MMQVKQAAAVFAAVLSMTAMAASDPARIDPARPAAPPRAAARLIAASDGITGLPYSALASAKYQSLYADALNARGVRYLRLDCISGSEGAAYASVWSSVPDGRAPRPGQSDRAACKHGPVAVFKVLAPPNYLGSGGAIAAYVDTRVPWSVVRTQTANFLYAARRLGG